jgi:hypothetical protein
VLKKRSNNASAASMLYSPLALMKLLASLSYAALLCKSLSTSNACGQRQRFGGTK